MKPFIVELPITERELRSAYRKHILEITKGKKMAAARILGINRRTLHRRGATPAKVALDDHLQMPLADNSNLGIY